LRHLSPSGLLFVGHSEHLGGISPELKSVAPTVYAPVNTDVEAQLGAVTDSDSSNLVSTR
ncbi:MAG TPA: hypothetical protein VIL63_13370, partial [Terriglobales bacterium]